MGRKRKPKDDHPKVGHNSGQITDENQRKLKGYVAEIERIDAQVGELKAEQKLMFDSAKDSNFDVKAIRAIVKERRIDKAKRQAFESVMDAYRHALGMLADTPLGQSAIERAVSSPKVQAAVARFGTPVELTEEERAKGATAAFVSKDGTRMTLGLGDTPAPVHHTDTSDRPF